MVNEIAKIAIKNEEQTKQRGSNRPQGSNTRDTNVKNCPDDSSINSNKYPLECACVRILQTAKITTTKIRNMDKAVPE